jgi:hypothetical protein
VIVCLHEHYGNWVHQSLGSIVDFDQAILIAIHWLDQVFMRPSSQCNGLLIWATIVAFGLMQASLRATKLSWTSLWPNFLVHEHHGEQPC